VIEFAAGTARVRAAMTMANAARLLPAMDPYLAGDKVEVDLAGIEDLDSSALALMLEWRRIGAARSCAVHYVGMPANLKTLADLYGVADLLL